MLLLEGGGREYGEQHGGVHDGGGAVAVHAEAHNPRQVARPQPRRRAHLRPALSSERANTRACALGVCHDGLPTPDGVPS